jgi:hypothetical protein
MNGDSGRDRASSGVSVPDQPQVNLVFSLRQPAGEQGHHVFCPASAQVRKEQQDPRALCHSFPETRIIVAHLAAQDVCSQSQTLLQIPLIQWHNAGRTIFSTRICYLTCRFSFRNLLIDANARGTSEPVGVLWQIPEFYPSVFRRISVNLPQFLLA